MRWLEGIASGQGDPLSPELFTLVASFVISPLRAPSPGLIMFIEGEADPNLLKSVWSLVQQFGYFSGLKVNLAKTSTMV